MTLPNIFFVFHVQKKSQIELSGFFSNNGKQFLTRCLQSNKIAATHSPIRFFKIVLFFLSFFFISNNNCDAHAHLAIYIIIINSRCDRFGDFFFAENTKIAFYLLWLTVLTEETSLDNSSSLSGFRSLLRVVIIPAGPEQEPRSLLKFLILAAATGCCPCFSELEKNL